MDNKELERIYNDTYRSVYWTAMSLLKNEADAEDIVQETYVTLIDSYDTLREKDKAAAWLKRTAANKCLDRLRRTKTNSSRMWKLCPRTFFRILFWNQLKGAG